MRRRLGAFAAALFALPLTTLAVLGASPGTVTFTEAMLQFAPETGTTGEVVGELPFAMETPALTLYSFCWPGNTNVNIPLLTVISDGSITGACSDGLEDVSGVPVEAIPPDYRVTSLVGTFDPATSTVSFVMEGSSTQFASFENEGVLHPPTYMHTIRAEAVSVPVVGNAVTATANFAYTCAPLLGGDCPMTSATGTVQFNMLFFPALPTVTAPPAASPTPSPSPSPSSGPLSVTLACSADLRNVNCTATPDGAGDGSDLAYAWTFNGSPQAETGASFQYDFIEAQLDNGSYGVSVTVTDNADGRTASDSTSVELGTFGSVADSNSNTLILLLVLAGAGAAVIGAFLLWLRGRAPKPDFVRAGLPAEPLVPRDDRTFAVGADRSGGFEDSLEYGEGAGIATPGASKAYEALVVATSSQATAGEPLVNPEGEVANTVKSEEDSAEDAANSRGGRDPNAREGR